jgi:hypothetical protein
MAFVVNVGHLVVFLLELTRMLSVLSVRAERVVPYSVGLTAFFARNPRLVWGPTEH